MVRKRTDSERGRPPLTSVRGVDTPLVIRPRRRESGPPARGIDRRLFEHIRQIRHQWTAVLVFDGQQEHHRFSDEIDLQRFLRRNERYEVLRTFQTVIHPSGSSGVESLDPDPEPIPA